MSRRTILRGAYEVREDIGQRTTVIKFDSMTLGSTPALDGSEFFTEQNYGGPDAIYEYSERDGRMVFSISNLFSPSYKVVFPVGNMAARWQSAGVFDGRVLLYIENARFEHSLANNAGQFDVRLYSYETPSSRRSITRYYGTNPFGTDSETVYKPELTGWVWLRMRSSLSLKTLSGKAWSADNDEPNSWDSEIVPNRIYAHQHPFGVPMFQNYLIRGLSSTVEGLVEIAEINWTIQ